MTASLLDSAYKCIKKLGEENIILTNKSTFAKCIYNYICKVIKNKMID